MFTYLPLKPIPTFFLKNKSNNVFNRKKIKKEITDIDNEKIQ